MKSSLYRYRKNLAILWFSSSAILFLLVLLRDYVNVYGAKGNEAWGWLMPSIIPTLSLIIGTFAKKGDVPDGGGDRFTYNLSFALSTVYLLAVAFTILVHPFLSVEMTPLELMKRANLWLGPFQGLVSGSLAAFFVKS